MSVPPSQPGTFCGEAARRNERGEALRRGAVVHRCVVLARQAREARREHEHRLALLNLDVGAKVVLDAELRELSRIGLRAVGVGPERLEHAVVVATDGRLVADVHRLGRGQRVGVAEVQPGVTERDRLVDLAVAVLVDHVRIGIGGIGDHLDGPRIDVGVAVVAVAIGHREAVLVEVLHGIVARHDAAAGTPDVGRVEVTADVPFAVTTLASTADAGRGVGIVVAELAVFAGGARGYDDPSTQQTHTKHSKSHSKAPCPAAKQPPTGGT